MPHTGVSAEDATVLWTQVSVLLTLAWLLGALARRLGQPAIVGSLIAGLVAGPSVFGHVLPAGFQWFRPGTQLHAGLLAAVADFSLLILLIGLGAETDVPLLRRLGRPAGVVVLGSLALPLAAGAAVALVLPASFLGGHPNRASFTLLVAAAMSVSSLPVIARIMTEMGMTRRNVGQLSIAAATVNDAVGFTVLALATALVSGGISKVAIAVGGLLGLVLVLPVIGQRGVDYALRRSRKHGPDVALGVGACVVFTLVVAAIAQALGIDAALGAFLAGIIIGRSRFVAPRVLDGIRWMSDAVFAPLYFATAGVSADVSLLSRGSVARWFVVIVVVAIASKALGVYGGGRLAGLPGREAAALGVSLNGRGALQVILATAGITAGVLGREAFTVIILLSILSSVSVPPLLRRTLRGWRGTEEEQERLAHEEEMTRNVVVRGQRLLLPTRGGANSVAAARVLDLAWPPDSEITLLRAAESDEQGIRNVHATLVAREIHEEMAASGQVVDAILAEANLGYGAIGVGAADAPTADHLLPVYIEELLNRSPIPLVIVRRGQQVSHDGGRPVIRPRRLLVPITGNAASRAGQEVAEMIGRNTGADLTLFHVVTRPDGDVAQNGRAPGRDSAKALVKEASQQAVEKNLLPDVVVRDAAFSGQAIAAEADRLDCDVVVVGTTVRRVADRPFLGHTIEHLLEHVRGPMVVAVVLPDAQQAAADEHIDRQVG